MRILRRFHFETSATLEKEDEVESIEDLPSYALFRGKFFEFFAYDDERDPIHLQYAEITSISMKQLLKDQNLEYEIVEDPKYKCDCGATKAKTTHAKWCSMIN